MVAGIDGRLQGMLRRAQVSLASAGALLQLVAYDGEPPFQAVEHFQHFGFASRPPASVEALLGLLGASHDHPVCIAERDSASRPELALGDAAVYGESPAGAIQARVHCRATGDVVVAGRSIEVGGTTDAMLLGTTYAADHQGMISHVSAALGSLATAMGGIATALSALGGEGALSTSTRDACTQAAGSAGTAATACTTAAGAITTFLAAGLTHLSARVTLS